MKYFLLLPFIFATLHADTPQEAVLQATLTVIPTPHRAETTIENYGKIQPGSKIKLAATVQNIGTAPNTPGKMSIRFVFPEPLADQPNSLLFQTDQFDVPSITPGQEVVLNFPTDLNWPSLYDFIRHDWGMRQFQAVMKIDGVEKPLGTLSIVFSAYYYEGPTKEITTHVPVVKPPEPKLKPAVTRNAQRPAVRQFAKQRVLSKEMAKK